MAKLTIDQICNFFDELSEETLEAFDWTPNPQLPNDTPHKTRRIKEVFKLTHRKRKCLYDESEIELCRSQFHLIVEENFHYVLKCRGLKARLNAICTADNYNTSHNTNMVGSRNQKTDGSNYSADMTENNDQTKFGGFRGTADATQLHTMLDSSKRLVDTKQIIEESQDKIMGYLDPNVRNYDHTVNIEKINTSQTRTSMGKNTTLSTNSHVHNQEGSRGIKAINELQALTVKLPKLRQQFCERFRPLFIC